MTTTEEVIRLTREVADAYLMTVPLASSIVLDIGEMKRLIKLVKAEENEACAKVCEELDNDEHTKPPYLDCAAAIRARRKACCEKS